MTKKKTKKKSKASASTVANKPEKKVNRKSNAYMEIIGDDDEFIDSDEVNCVTVASAKLHITPASETSTETSSGTTSETSSEISSGTISGTSSGTISGTISGTTSETTSETVSGTSSGTSCSFDNEPKPRTSRALRSGKKVSGDPSKGQSDSSQEIADILLQTQRRQREVLTFFEREITKNKARVYYKNRDELANRLNMTTDNFRKTVQRLAKKNLMETVGLPGIGGTFYDIPAAVLAELHKSNIADHAQD